LKRYGILVNIPLGEPPKNSYINKLWEDSKDKSTKAIKAYVL